jgi:hypothetical protein
VLSFLPTGQTTGWQEKWNVLLLSVTLSHEVLEMLGDPHINLLVQDTTTMSAVDPTAGSCKLVHAAEDGQAAGADRTRPGGGHRKDRRAKPRTDWRRSAT